MKKRFYSSVLAMLLCMVSTAVWAQTHVSTADQLRAIGASESVVLDNDIDLGGTWSSIAGYSGTFDGGGFTITNLGNNALFNTTTGTATIKNLTITGGTRAMNSDNGNGVFVNQCQGNLTIQNCVNETPLTGDGWNWHAGGYVGQIDVADVTVDIIDCVNKADVTVENIRGGWGSQIGGFVGFLTTTGAKLNFTRCQNLGNVTNTSGSNTGGFLGKSDGSNNVTFTNCTNSGTVTASGTQTGGLLGFIAGSGASVEFINCLNTGEVTSTSWSVGGIAGQSNQASMSFKNCGNTGKITCTSEGEEACPLVGNLYACSPTATYCWNIGETQGSASSLPLISRNGGTCTNCYDKYNDTPSGVTLITDEQVTSGELCFLLNGSVSGGTNTYQTLGTDLYPVYDATHGQIYTKGYYYCDGVTPKGGTTEYTNDPDENVVDPHTCVDGICSECGAIDPALIVDGVYQIPNAGVLMAFHNLTGVANASAKLTANIDMTGQGWTSLTGYAGTFDGDGHTITGLGTPLINTTASGATIKNLTLSGSLTTTQTHFAAFVNSSVGNLTLENLINETAITGSNERVAGIIGGVGANSTVNITNCVNKADININNNWIGGIVGFGYNAVQLTLTGCLNTGNITGNQAGIGGIIAQTNNYGGGLNTLINCGNTGAITNRNENHAGGIFGFVYASTSNLTNCWNIGQTIGSDGTDTQQLIAFNSSSTITYTNCYNTGGITAGVTQIQAADAASGALCFLLNGSVSGGTTFYQTLGTDAYPVLDSTHGKVYQKGTVRCDGVTPAEGATVEYLNTEAAPTVQPHNYVEGICDFCGTFQMDFVTVTDGVYQIGTAAQLRWFSAALNATTIANNSNAVLTADIDLENVAFTPIGLFADDTDAGGQRIQYRGTFDGQKHIISNLTINDTKKHETGLFSRLAWGGNAVIRNLGVVNATINSSHPYGRAGVIAGITGGNCTIENCYVTGDVTVTVPDGTEWGGITGGGSAGTIRNCWTSYTRVGGGGTQTNCYAATASQMESGELCYNINDGAGETIFYQSIGEDSYPVFGNTHGRVSKMSTAGYATFYDTTTAGTFGGAEVYTVSEKVTAGDVSYVRLVQQDNTIPASTAVILKGTEGEVSYFSFTPTASASAISGTNMLQGTSAGGFVATGNEYVLAMPEEATKAGLYPMMAGSTIPAGKAYLPDGNGVKGFVFSFDDDITGINIATSADLQNDIIYNVAGQRVQKMQKGINIVSGKKVLVK